MAFSAFAASAEEQPLGRLFFTAQQRATLDRQRRQVPRASDTLNGEVRRSSGKNTRWVNGEAQSLDNAASGAVANRTLPLPGSGRIVVSPGR